MQLASHAVLAGAGPDEHEDAAGQGGLHRGEQKYAKRLRMPVLQFRKCVRFCVQYLAAAFLMRHKLTHGGITISPRQFMA